MIIVKSLCLWEASEELSPNTGGSGITWQSQCFFQFWVVQTLILTKLLISVVPRNFLLPKNTCRCFFLEYLSKLLERILGNFIKQCHYVVAIATLPCRKRACCFVHLTVLLHNWIWKFRNSFFTLTFYRPGKCQCFI